MSALVCEKPIATDASPRCADLADLVQSLREEVGQLRREVTTLRAEAGYWKSRHADAVKRNRQLQAELQQARGDIRQLKDKLFGRRSERRLAGQDLAKLVEEERPSPPRKRGGQPGHRGHRRIDYSHLPAVEEICTLSAEEQRCQRCGKPRLEMSDTEDSEQVEIEVRAHRRVIRRKRFRAMCDCPDRPLTVTAPPAPKLIPKGIYGISVWVYLLLDKFSSHRPTTRSIEQLRLEGLPLSAGTIAAGFQRLELLLEPIYRAFVVQNRQGEFHQADETRWMVYVEQEGKVGYRWWLWVVLSRETVVYLLDPRRSHDVPEEHFSEEASGILLVDRYSAYKAMSQVKLGALLLAFCWSHVRRDFLEVGKGFEELVPWVLEWLRRIRDVYRTNRQRIAHEAGTKEFIEHDARLREQLAQMNQKAEEELGDTKLRLPCRKVLESLKNHWEGLFRFVDRPEIPMDNNGSERILRNPALGRKNYYGSGSLWSGRLTATMFSILATLKLWKLNPRAWLTWYFEQCAATAGKAPDDIEPFLPWNLSEDQIAALRISPPEPPLLDSS
jgi:transposase